MPGDCQWKPACGGTVTVVVSRTSFHKGSGDSNNPSLEPRTVNGIRFKLPFGHCSVQVQKHLHSPDPNKQGSAQDYLIV